MIFFVFLRFFEVQYIVALLFPSDNQRGRKKVNCLNKVWVATLNVATEYFSN